MNIEIDFEKVKQTILLAALKQGLSEAELKDWIEDYDENWRICYTSNQNESFLDTLSDLKEEVKLLSQAVPQHDLLASISAIILAKIYSLTLMNFFDKIDGDIFLLGWGTKLKDKWPSVPEDYKVPDSYKNEVTSTEETTKINIDVDFEKIKQTILSAAMMHGLSKDYITKHWHIDYELDLNKEFARLISGLNQNIQIIYQAIKNNDMLTAKAGIIRVKPFSHALVDFLTKIDDDMFELGWGDKLKDKWPDIPENYKVPAHYDYENTNKPYQY